MLLNELKSFDKDSLLSILIKSDIYSELSIINFLESFYIEKYFKLPLSSYNEILKRDIIFNYFLFLEDSYFIPNLIRFNVPSLNISNVSPTKLLFIDSPFSSGLSKTDIFLSFYDNKYISSNYFDLCVFLNGFLYDLDNNNFKLKFS